MRINTIYFDILLTFNRIINMVCLKYWNNIIMASRFLYHLSYIRIMKGWKKSLSFKSFWNGSCILNRHNVKIISLSNSVRLSLEFPPIVEDKLLKLSDFPESSPNISSSSRASCIAYVIEESKNPIKYNYYLLFRVISEHSANYRSGCQGNHLQQKFLFQINFCEYFPIGLIMLNNYSIESPKTFFSCAPVYKYPYHLGLAHVLHYLFKVILRIYCNHFILSAKTFFHVFNL